MTKTTTPLNLPVDAKVKRDNKWQRVSAVDAEFKKSYDCSDFIE